MVSAISSSLPLNPILTNALIFFLMKKRISIYGVSYLLTSFYESNSYPFCVFRSWQLWNLLFASFGIMSKRYLVVPKGDGLLQSKRVIEFNIFVKHLADVEEPVLDLEAGKFRWSNNGDEQISRCQITLMLVELCGRPQKPFCSH